MEYVITNGRSFLRINAKTNGWEGCSNSGLAYTFHDYNKASNAVANLPKSMKNLGYDVYRVTDIEKGLEKGELADSTSVSSIDDESIFYDSIPEFDDVINSLVYFEEFVDHILSQRREVEDRLQRINDELQDIEHAIEFYNYNACDGFKIYKKMHDARVERRKLKNTIILMDVLNDCTTPSLLKSRPSDRLSGLKNRKYKVRCDKELFKEVK